MTSKPPRRHLPSSPFIRPAEPATVHYTVGERVSHDVFGVGRVLNVESTIAVSVDFGSRTERITLPTTRLFPL